MAMASNDTNLLTRLDRILASDIKPDADFLEVVDLWYPEMREALLQQLMVDDLELLLPPQAVEMIFNRDGVDTARQIGPIQIIFAALAVAFDILDIEPIY